VLEDNILRIAVVHCLLPAERTGARSFAASPEGEVVERLLARAGRQNPGSLFAKVPRCAQSCPHFREALGRARTQPEVTAALEEMVEGRSTPPLEGLVAAGFRGESWDVTEAESADPFAVLGVTESADDGTIRRGYLRLVRQHPP
jgi:hypothetical protein